MTGNLTSGSQSQMNFALAVFPGALSPLDRQETGRSPCRASTPRDRRHRRGAGGTVGQPALRIGRSRRHLERGHTRHDHQSAAAALVTEVVRSLPASRNRPGSLRLRVSPAPR